MMKFNLVIVILFLFSTGTYGQTDPCSLSTQPFIEVKDTLVKWLAPDEIFMSIVLTNKIVGKRQQTIQNQEAGLKKTLKRNNINEGLLTNFDSTESDEYFLKDTGNANRKVFKLQLSTIAQAYKVAEGLKAFNIRPTLLYKSEYSKMDKLIEVIQKVALRRTLSRGKILLKSKGENVVQPFCKQNRIIHAMYRDYTTTNKNIEEVNITPPVGESEIVFEKLKISVTYTLKYAIKNFAHQVKL